MKSDELITSPYGFIASNRRIVTLGDICVEKDGIQTGPFGSQLHSADYVDVGTPIIMVEHLGENVIKSESTPFVSDEDMKRLVKYTMKPGDIIFSRVGYVDKRALVQDKHDGWLFSGSLLRIRPNPKLVDATYLSYFFGLPRLKKYMGDVSVGATRPSINTSILKSIPVVLPEMRVQKVVGEILSLIDERIASNIALSKTLENIAQSIFKAWFIDFDPVKAKMSGEKPAGMDDATAALFPDSMEESELGLIPRGWEIAPIGRVLDVNGGTTPSTTNAAFWRGEHCWLTPKDLSSQTGIISISSGRKITDLGLAQISSGLLPINSVLMSCRAPIGYVSINAVPTAVNQGFITLKYSPEFHPLYVLNWINANMQEIHNRAGGATFAEITRKAFREILFLKPSATLLNKYSELAEPLLQQIEQLTRQTENLQAIRDSLLPRLISGELQIPEELLTA